ncbi:MAG: tetraacyldisaccharide 4'-kinase [Armatimonadetes bacterium]|nr:tetraacyldisaccharide 4'-kinase [Armatimonadota bacterium]
MAEPVRPEVVPSLEDRWYHVVSGEATSLLAALARGGLSAAAGLYSLGLRANLGLYQWGLKARTRPALPVVSIGNITLGGTGKTTAVRFLVARLAQAGIRAGIVLRGHGGRVPAPCLVTDGQGNVRAADDAGDEALEYARLLTGTPVAVGKRRETSIRLLAEAGAQIAVLDDGYQYFRMHRDLDIVLVSARTDLRLAHLFPRGVLREPWSHLGRVDQVWITHADQASPGELDQVRGLVRRNAPQAAVALTMHRAEKLVDLATGAVRPVEDLHGKNVVALSALGSPTTFEGSLRGLGCEVIPLRFPDHHSYRPQDWERGALLAREHGASFIVTTLKDAVKVKFEVPWPTLVLRSELHFLSGEEHLDVAIDRLRQRVAGE